MKSIGMGVVVSFGRGNGRSLARSLGGTRELLLYRSLCVCVACFATRGKPRRGCMRGPAASLRQGVRTKLLLQQRLLVLEGAARAGQRDGLLVLLRLLVLVLLCRSLCLHHGRQLHLQLLQVGWRVGLLLRGGVLLLLLLLHHRRRELVAGQRAGQRLQRLQARDHQLLLRCARLLHGLLRQRLRLRRRRGRRGRRRAASWRGVGVGMRGGQLRGHTLRIRGGGVLEHQAVPHLALRHQQRVQHLYVRLDGRGGQGEGVGAALQRVGVEGRGGEGGW